MASAMFAGKKGRSEQFVYMPHLNHSSCLIIGVSKICFVVNPSTAPIHSLKEAISRGSLGDLNPTPWYVGRYG